MSMEDSEKTPEGNAMDIVSMAFSDVSGNGDLMEVVTAVSDPVADGQATVTEDGEHNVHCVESQVEEEVLNQGDLEQPRQIEIPLPHNAIITVNDQGEQIIEFPQVVTQDPDENCVIIEQQPDQTCQTSTSDLQPVPQEGDEGVLAHHITEGGNGLETLTFHDQGQDVVDEPCVVPVTISLTDVQKIQEAVSSAVPDNIIPNDARTNQVPHGHVVTTGISGLSANSLLGSFANIIHTSTVLSNSNNVSQSSSSAFASPASASTTTTNKTPTAGGSVISSSPTPAAQFIHNGTNLQQINLNDAVLPQTSLSQSVLNNLQPVSGSRSVLNNANSSIVNLTAQSQKPDSTTLGNRSVFSPMTLTIRTPPGSPAVNQTLINSIVNNTEVQALLKRNPGQPITIVRVPEDPYEKRNRLGLNAKIITTNSSTFNTPTNRPGRARKDVTMLGNNAAAKTFAGKKRKRQPGTKVPKKEVEYVPPPGWKPVKSRTRSGRISRPPLYRTENFRTLPLVDRQDSQPSDDEELSDLEPAEPVTTTQGGRLKSFKCRSCSKAYIGRAGLARHLMAEPLHGSIEEYEQSEPTTSSKAESPSVDGVSNNKPVDQTNSEGVVDRLLEDSKSPVTGPPSPDKQPETIGIDTTESAKDDTPTKRRKGRPPFRPVMTETMLNIRKKEKQKESLRNTLGFLSNEDLMDVCLPRLASTLSPWEFLLSKAEMTKDNSSEVLKVLQLFEELVSEVREMALNCLEKADDNEQDTEGIFLDEDDDLARVLDFEKGWYKVSEPPPGATDAPFRYKLLEAEGIASTLKRTVEVISKDDVKDSAEPEMKKMRLEKDQASVIPQKPEASPEGGTSILQPVSNHAKEEGNASSETSVNTGELNMEKVSGVESDQLETTSPNLKTNQESDASRIITAINPSAQTSDTVTPMDQEQPTGTEPSTVHNQASGITEPSTQAQSPTLVTPLDSEQHTTTEEMGESSGGKQWAEEGEAIPSEIGVEFVQRAEELSALAASATDDQGEMKHAHQPEQAHQEETSVVVPEGSTIMQMQDGTFLVQRPDGTAMQIHTPEGMTIETVQELLSMEVGQG